MSRERVRSGQASGDSPLTLTYDLDELPSSQHRAGLAGLILMQRWHGGQPARKGTCELTLGGPRAATLRIDREGLASLLDEVYGATAEERAYPRPFAKKAPLREEEREELDSRTQKLKKTTVYIYPVTVPRGAFLAHWDRSPEGVWIKLWRDMMWQILRGKPATRAPFEARAAGKTDALAADLWRDLARPGAVVDLPSTYFLGAQARTAENVPFRDLARNQLLLHFWPFVAQIYVPTFLDTEGKTRFRPYALAVPDVADLDVFCDELSHALQQRTGAVAGYVPRDAIVDLPAAGGLDLMARLADHAGARHPEDLLYGVDVFHIEKSGNNVHVLGAARVDPEPRMIDHYVRIRDGYRAHIFRAQRLENLLRDRPWHSGFDRLLCTTPARLTIQSTWFRGDTRNAFKKSEEFMNDNDNQQGSERSIESLVYRVIGIYIGYRLRARHQLEWDSVKGLDDKDPKRKDYHDKRQDVAREAFLAVRSRAGADFIDYFCSTLFSAPQKLGEDAYTALSRALLDDPERIRTLTLLALSARA